MTPSLKMHLYTRRKIQFVIKQYLLPEQCSVVPVLCSGGVVGGGVVGGGVVPGGVVVLNTQLIYSWH